MKCSMESMCFRYLICSDMILDWPKVISFVILMIKGLRYHFFPFEIPFFFKLIKFGQQFSDILISIIMIWQRSFKYVCILYWIMHILYVICMYFSGPSCNSYKSRIHARTWYFRVIHKLVQQRYIFVYDVYIIIIIIIIHFYWICIYNRYQIVNL